MHSLATTFANQFDVAFKRETAASPFKEVQLFRAMMRAFAGLRPKYYLEEYHGSRRQIYFDTSYSWMRSRARCELCDVLFLVYSTAGGFSLRATLLQAKRSRAAHTTGSHSFAGKIEPQSFEANFEQWDLLAGRPSLIPTSVFSPPADLLSAALLPSIGSFGVFHKQSSKSVDLFYASADCLKPSATPAGPGARYGKLSTRHGGVSIRATRGWIESVYCASAHSFAKALYQLQIGTPVLNSLPNGRVEGFAPFARWIETVLRSHLSVTKSSAPLAGLLLDQLGVGFDTPRFTDRMDSEKQPTVLILRSEHSPTERE